MNGLCPDFVLLHPRIGVQIIEVKDWNLSAMPWKWKPVGPSILALHRQTRNGRWFREKRDSFTQLRLYRDELAELYCPRLGANLAARFGKNLPILSASIAFPNEPKNRAMEFLSDAFMFYEINEKHQARYCSVISADEILGGNIGSAIPFSTLTPKTMS